MPTDRHPLRRNREETQPESLLEKVMRTKKQLEDKQDSYFKPKEGINRVRIMPSWRGRGEPFYVQIPTHKNIGPDNKWATCLQFWQEDCPVCTDMEKLSRSNNSRDQNTASDMRPDDRVLMNVGYPNNEEGIIKPWSISEKWLLELLGYFTDPEFGDFTDPKEGYDYIFTRRGQMLKTRYDAKHFANKSTPIRIPNARKKLINLDLFPKRYTRKQMRAFLIGEEAE